MTGASPACATLDSLSMSSRSAGRIAIVFGAFATLGADGLQRLLVPAIAVGVVLLGLLLSVAAHAVDHARYRVYRDRLRQG